MGAICMGAIPTVIGWKAGSGHQSIAGHIHIYITHTFIYICLCLGSNLEYVNSSISAKKCLGHVKHLNFVKFCQYIAMQQFVVFKEQGYFSKTHDPSNPKHIQ